VSGARRKNEWNRLCEMLEVPNSHGESMRQLDGYQVTRPSLTVPSDRGAIRQLKWTLENWIRPYLDRVRAGIEYDPRIHHMPTEPDWRTDRGRGNLPTRLAIPYGDDWQSWWHRKGKAIKKARRAAARRARD
jgi:hypothetical protein